MLIAPDLRVVGHVNVHEPGAREPRGYLAFLRAGLAAARGEPPPAEPEAPDAAAEHAGGVSPLVLTREAPGGSLLDVIRRGGFGERALSFFPIDATAFEGPGELEITVRVGGAEASGRFELCAAAEDDPSLFGPVRELPEVAPGESATMRLAFERGALFGLAAMAGPGCDEGDVNAFLATVTVRPR